MIARPGGRRFGSRAESLSRVAIIEGIVAVSELVMAMVGVAEIVMEGGLILLPLSSSELSLAES